MERRRLVVAVLCLLVHGHVSGFSFTQCGKRPRFDLFAATEGAGGDADAPTGAGAYRSKAKEFASDPESFEDGLDDKKTLTISFVVSPPVSVGAGESTHRQAYNLPSSTRPETP